MLASVWSLDVGMVCGGVDIAVGDDCGTRMLSVVGGGLIVIHRNLPPC